MRTRSSLEKHWVIANYEESGYRLAGFRPRRGVIRKDHFVLLLPQLRRGAEIVFPRLFRGVAETVSGGEKSGLGEAVPGRGWRRILLVGGYSEGDAGAAAKADGSPGARADDAV